MTIREFIKKLQACADQDALVRISIDNVDAREVIIHEIPERGVIVIAEP